MKMTLLLIYKGLRGYFRGNPRESLARAEILATG